MVARPLPFTVTVVQGCWFSRLLQSWGEGDMASGQVKILVGKAGVSHSCKPGEGRAGVRSFSVVCTVFLFLCSNMIPVSLFLPCSVTVTEWLCQMLVLNKSIYVQQDAIGFAVQVGSASS